jgi:O-succinylbenzoate synthase
MFVHRYTLRLRRGGVREGALLRVDDGFADVHLRARTGLRLALDRFEGVADVLVHKPALQTTRPPHNDVVVTSYIDHPVGQFGAACVAAMHDTNPRCGLMTHVLYEEDAFIERVERDGARLLPPRGTGIGFDDLLEKLRWTSIG